MPYHSIVLAKQVPDTKNITGQAMKEDGFGPRRLVQDPVQLDRGIDLQGLDGVGLTVLGIEGRGRQESGENGHPEKELPQVNILH